MIALTHMRAVTLFISLLLLALFSCNPARRIEMKNKTADTAEVIWTLKEDSIGFNAFNISNNREQKFILPPHRHSSVQMSFGVGNWSPSEVEKLIHRVESFQIISPRHKFRIDSLPQLRDYLLARRKGLGGSRIQIVID